MSNESRSNAGRWLLAFQALVFFVVGGFEVWAYPQETCPYMATSRSLVEERIVFVEGAGRRDRNIGQPLRGRRATHRNRLRPLGGLQRGQGKGGDYNDAPMDRTTPYCSRGLILQKYLNCALERTAPSRSDRTGG